MFNPVSPQGLAISNVFILTLLIAAVIFALVAGLVIYIAVKYRGRPGAVDPEPNFGHTRLEMAWTAGPALILAVLLVLTIKAMGESDPAASDASARAANVASGQQASDQPDIVVIGHQWWWEVRYPGPGVVTANEIYLPTGKRMLVRVESADVNHDLWIPQLGRKMDMIAGQPNYITLEADVPGVYLGACSEYCGVEHGKMLIRAIAESPQAFQSWEQEQKVAAPAPPAGGNAAVGAQLFAQKTCISCHAINGTAANGRAGPDLSHLASRQTLASGVIPNTPKNLADWLKNPQIIKPGSYMPNLQLTDGEVQGLVAYLETLK